MNKKTFPRILSLLLTVTMVISSMVVTSLPAVAEEAETPTYTAPEVVVKGEVDVWDKTTQTEPTQTDADGYILITSAAEFVWFMNNDTGSNNYRLTTSIDLASQKVGGSKTFAGVLDGDGYTISSARYYADYNGLFYFFTTVDGTIKNLNFKDFYIKGGGGKASLVQTLTGRLENCHFNFAYYESQNGGVVSVSANGDAVITDCILSGTIQSGGGGGVGYGYGGFVEYLGGNAQVRNCANYASIHMTGKGPCGAIVSDLGSATAVIENCVNYGSITSTSTDAGAKVGGIIGQITSSIVNPVISNCVNYGDISAASHTGSIIGFIGNLNNSSITLTIEDCYNFGNIKSTDTGSTVGHGVGGIIGSCNRLLYVNNCANYGDVAAAGTKAYAGGIVGSHSGRWNQYSTGFPSGVQLRNSASYGNVSSTYSAGGIAGYYDGTSHASINGYYLYNSVITGDVSAPYAGHLLGYCYSNYTNNKLKMVLDGSILSGSITSTGVTSEDVTTYYAGILVGYFATAKTFGVTVGNNCYINESGLTTLFDVAGTLKTAADYETYTPAAYSTEAIVSEETLTAFNSFADANEYSIWYMSGTKKAPVPVNQLQLTRATVMIADYIFVVAQAEDIVALPENAVLEIKDQAGNLAKGALAEDNTYQFVLEGINLTDIATEKQYTMLVNGEEAMVTYNFSVIDLLADLYNNGNTSPNEQSLIHSMVNVCYVADPTTDAFTKFNAVAGTTLEPLSLADVAPLADAGDVYTYDGCKIALDLKNGFTLVPCDANGAPVGDGVTKGVYNLYDVVTVGNAGETTVAAMLNAYLAMAETHDLAAACILYCQAAELVNP